MSVFRRNYM